MNYIPLEEMQGQRVVIVANLKAGNMRGVKSQAMVLAASSADGEQVSSPLHLSLQGAGNNGPDVQVAWALSVQ